MNFMENKIIRHPVNSNYQFNLKFKCYEKHPCSYYATHHMYEA